jgi:hypothetical protein
MQKGRAIDKTFSGLLTPGIIVRAASPLRVAAQSQS